jgi:phosphatidylinositol-3-phosphatase
MLSSQGYKQAFVTSKGHPYLAKTLRAQGELLNDYYGVTSSPLANEIGLISGQGPTPQTAANCPVFNTLAPAKKGPRSQVLGDGCSYPSTTPTLVNELTKTHDTWKGYIQGIDAGPKGQLKACRHPVFGAADPGQVTSTKAAYVTWTNPFVYFGSVTGDGKCATQDVGTDQLAKDLKNVSTTPAFSYIAPNPCDNGSDQPCAPGAPAGLEASDAFLKSIVPEIQKSPAFRQDGLLMITFDHAPQTGTTIDTTSCCNQPTFPNLQNGAAVTGTPTTTTGTTTTGTTTTGATTTGATPTTTTIGTTTPATCPTTTGTGITTTTGATTGTTTAGTTGAPATATPTGSNCTNPDGTPFGGGQVGMLLISRYVKANSTDAVDSFNHFSLLKTLADLFGVKRPGYATDASLPEFDQGIFNAGTP